MIKTVKENRKTPDQNGLKMLLHFSSKYTEALKLTGSRSTSLLPASLHPLVVVASYCSQKQQHNQD